VEPFTDVIISNELFTNVPFKLYTDREEIAVREVAASLIL